MQSYMCIPHLPMLPSPVGSHHCNLITCIVHENLSTVALLEVNILLLLFFFSE